MLTNDYTHIYSAAHRSAEELRAINDWERKSGFLSFAAFIQADFILCSHSDVGTGADLATLLEDMPGPMPGPLIGDNPEPREFARLRSAPREGCRNCRVQVELRLPRNARYSLKKICSIEELNFTT